MMMVRSCLWRCSKNWACLHVELWRVVARGVGGWWVAVSNGLGVWFGSEPRSERPDYDPWPASVTLTTTRHAPEVFIDTFSSLGNALHMSPSVSLISSL